MASISHRIGSARSTIRCASSTPALAVTQPASTPAASTAVDLILPPSSFILEVERLAVHLDVAVQRHLLGDEALGEAAGLGVADQVGEPVRGLARLHLEKGRYAFPAVEHGALQDRAAEVLAEGDAAARALHLHLHHVRVPRNLGEQSEPYGH